MSSNRPDVEEDIIDHKAVRPSWNVYFVSMAHLISRRATCDRKHVGAVLVREKRVISSGYNGSVPGLPHCDDVGHDMDEGHCVRTIHAEVNAISQAARFGQSVLGASLYVNTFPCWPCFKILAASGIGTIFFDDDYRVDHRVIECAERTGICLYSPKVWKPREE